MFEVTVQHQGLHAYKVVKGYSAQEAELKAALQLRKWEEQWARVQQIRKREDQKTQISMLKDQAKALAADQNDEAEKRIQSLETLLRDSARLDHHVNWEKLKQSTCYPVAVPGPPSLAPITAEPKRQTPVVQLGFIARLIPSIRAKKETEAQALAEKLFQSSHAEWERQKATIEATNKSQREQHEEAIKKHHADEQAYIEQANAHNEAIGQQREAYLRKEPEAVVDYCHRSEEHTSEL